MAAFSFVCRSTPKLLDRRTTGLCQLSETCRHYRVLHNLDCLKDVDRCDGRITCFNSVSRPTRLRRLFSLRGSFASYVGMNMLLYLISQSLGCASYVTRITLARKFINNGNFLVGRHAILLNGWKGSPRAVNNTRIDSKETFSYGLSNLTLESQGSVTNTW